MYDDEQDYREYCKNEVLGDSRKQDKPNEELKEQETICQLYRKKKFIVTQSGGVIQLYHEENWDYEILETVRYDELTGYKMIKEKTYTVILRVIDEKDPKKIESKELGVFRKEALEPFINSFVDFLNDKEEFSFCVPEKPLTNEERRTKELTEALSGNTNNDDSDVRKIVEEMLKEHEATITEVAKNAALEAVKVVEANKVTNKPVIEEETRTPVKARR